MKTNSHVKSIIILLIIGLFLSNCQLNQKTEEKQATDDDKYRQDFWLKSEYALGKDYRVKVWLPGSYYDSNKKYPVLYITDADWFFDFASIMAYHLEQNSKEIILVGISYGSRDSCWQKRILDFRSDHFNEAGIPGYALFIKFFRDELFPVIESRFRAESTNRTLFGWSNGFYFACHTLYEQRTLFDNYILGGGLFPENWPDQLKLKERTNLRQEKTESPIGIYVGHPEFDAPRDQFLSSIQSLKNQDFADIFLEWEIFEGKGHTFPTVAEIIINGMEYTFNKKSIVQSMLKTIDSKNIGEAIKDYERWKAMNPLLCDYNPGELKKVATVLGEQQNNQEHRELLEYIEKKFPKRNITINVIASKLPPSSTIYITGNHEEIADWNPSAIALTHFQNNTWSKTFPVEEGSQLEYKFTLGSWETEALNEEGEVLSNFTYKVKCDTVLIIEINNWKGK